MKGIEISGKPIAYLCSSQAKLEAMLDDSRKNSKKGTFLLLAEPKSNLQERIIPAYINSAIREQEKCMRANNIQMEMLLFLSGTMNIGKAIRDSGAKSSSKFVLISNKETLISSFCKKFGIKKLQKYVLTLDYDVSGKVALTELENKG